MYVDDIEQLDDLSDDQLWEVAANTRVATDIRHEAIQRWLYPQETEPYADPDEFAGGRLHQLRQRATILEDDEVDEYEVEDFVTAHR